MSGIVRCGGCGQAQTRFDTRDGRLVEVPSPCRCPEWRRINFICRHCDRPVTGKKGVARYCDEHRRAARAAVVRRNRPNQLAAKRRYQERNAEKLREKARNYWSRSEENRERHRANKRRWRRANPDKVKAQRIRSAVRSLDKPCDYSVRYHNEVAAGVRQPNRARRDEQGRRLCFTDGCMSIMRGRKKLCARCREAARSA